MRGPTKYGAQRARQHETAAPAPIADCNKEWLFGSFWLAINAELEKRGLPEVGFKGAREAWEAALEIAQQSPAACLPSKSSDLPVWQPDQ